MLDGIGFLALHELNFAQCKAAFGSVNGFWLIVGGESCCVH
jgi:hypothetical protein